MLTIHIQHNSTIVFLRKKRGWACIMVVIFVRNSAIWGIFFAVRILRNDKSSLYTKKRYYQVTKLISALMWMVLYIKIVFKRVKLQFIWQIKIECCFCGNKNDNHAFKLQIGLISNDHAIQFPILQYNTRTVKNR